MKALIASATDGFQRFCGLFDISLLFENKHGIRPRRIASRESIKINKIQ